MIIRTADFVVSNSDPELCPKPNKPEFAFIGRSNVGKSSLINLLVDRQGLAKTSSTPGKTQLINHFIVNGEWYLVDLPGYGYTRISKTVSGAWGPMIENFLTKRSSLMTTFVLIDPRLEPQKTDLEFIQWLGENRIPFSLVFTKADKISKGQLLTTRKLWESTLEKTWEELPLFFSTSAHDRKGREELLTYIGSLVASRGKR